MLPINRLLEYQAEVVATLLDTQNKTIFNYSTMVIDDTELSKVLEDRSEGENTMFISVLPEFRMKGQENNAKWKNILMFFILDKTDYSEHDRDGLLNIFVKTQDKALDFINKLLDDKSDNQSIFCNFLSWLDENSIGVYPVWKKNGCNGWRVEINLDTAL